MAGREAEILKSCLGPIPSSGIQKPEVAAEPGDGGPGRRGSLQQRATKARPKWPLGLGRQEPKKAEPQSS